MSWTCRCAPWLLPGGGCCAAGTERLAGCLCLWAAASLVMPAGSGAQRFAGPDARSCRRIARPGPLCCAGADAEAAQARHCHGGGLLRGWRQHSRHVLRSHCAPAATGHYVGSGCMAARLAEAGFGWRLALGSTMCGSPAGPGPPEMFVFPARADALPGADCSRQCGLWPNWPKGGQLRRRLWLVAPGAHRGCARLAHAAGAPSRAAACTRCSQWSLHAR